LTVHLSEHSTVHDLTIPPPAQLSRLYSTHRPTICSPYHSQ